MHSAVVGSTTYDQAVVDSPAPLDTEPEVFRRQVDRWRQMTPAERAALADRLSIDVAALASSGIRHVQPDISEDRLAHELVRRRHGRDLADGAWHHVDPA